MAHRKIHLRYMSDTTYRVHWDTCKHQLVNTLDVSRALLLAALGRTLTLTLTFPAHHGGYRTRAWSFHVVPCLGLRVRWSAVSALSDNVLSDACVDPPGSRGFVESRARRGHTARSHTHASRRAGRGMHEVRCSSLEQLTLHRTRCDGGPALILTRKDRRGR